MSVAVKTEMILALMELMTVGETGQKKKKVKNNYKV